MSSRVSTDVELGSLDPGKATAAVGDGTEDRDTLRDVRWDSNDDPRNPHNWSTLKQSVNLGLVCILATIPPLESSTIVPAVPLLIEEFHETRDTVVSLVVCVFVLGFAVGPLLPAPLSESYGRRIVYNVTNVIHLGFTLGCALAPNITTFIVLRLFAGLFGAAPMSVVGGSVADQVSVEKRGAVLSVLFSGMFLGPIIGPIMGGFIGEGVGWRWIFWLHTIMAGVMTVISFFFLSESHTPTLLRQKAQRLNRLHPNTYSVPKVNAKATLFRAIARPVRMLIFSPIVTSLSLYLALVYGYLYLLFTTFSTVFPDQYDFGIGILGLSFLGLGVGALLALLFMSWFSDWKQAQLTRKHGVSKPEYRLIGLIFGIPLLPIGLFGYGWTAQYKIHWIVPMIFTSFAGAGLIFTFVPTQIYLVDAFSQYAASALAATSVVRSIFGGCLPIAGLPMYSALGLGWGNSLLGFIALALSIAPLILWIYGETLRTKYTVSFD